MKQDFEKSAKLYVAGHNGMVGQSILRRLRADGYENIITLSSDELDLRNGPAVQEMLRQCQPEFIFVAAAKVGGIHANNVYRADFIYDNIMIEANLIHGAHMAGVQNVMFLGSSCIYPRECEQPIKEEYLLTGPLEPTNEPYAIAKIAGVKLCESYKRQYGRNYFSVMPTNTYGPGDNYHPEDSHVMASLIRKAHFAKVNGDASLPVWGTGRPKREFMYVDDLADACVFLMHNQTSFDLINIGQGSDVSIASLAQMVCDVVGFGGKLVFDTDKPDGTPRKLMDSTRLYSMGWAPATSLLEGIDKAYRAAPFF